MSRKINLLSVSGGKDSTAMILLAMERGVEFRAAFADTGHEHPSTYEYIDYLEEKLRISIIRVRADFSERIANKRKFIEEHWVDDGVDPARVARALELLHPTGNPFLDLCLWKGRFPSRKAQFCTAELKVGPLTKQVIMPILKTGVGVRSWQGIRRAESQQRAKYVYHERIDLRTLWAYRPLLDWSAEDVFAIHKKHGVDPNPLYKQAMGRVGCLPCINCAKKELMEIARRWPEEIARVREWERLVSQVAKRGSSTLIPACAMDRGNTDVDYLSHGIDAAVAWAQTQRGGKQFDLFDTVGEIPPCSSNYGLCEVE